MNHTAGWVVLLSYKLEALSNVRWFDATSGFQVDYRTDPAMVLLQKISGFRSLLSQLYSC